MYMRKIVYGMLASLLCTSLSAEEELLKYADFEHCPGPTATSMRKVPAW